MQLVLSATVSGITVGLLTVNVVDDGVFGGSVTLLGTGAITSTTRGTFSVTV